MDKLNCKYTSVIFDCDSTLAAIEGVDELADLKGLGMQVRNLTNKAMEGKISFREAFEARWNLIKPNKGDAEWLGYHYITNLTDGAEDIVKTLYRSNVAVYILTGGIKPSVDILGKYLGIKSENIFAIDIFFDSSGNYSGYEKGSPLLSKEGKSSVIKKIKKKHKVAFIGDGANDLEAGSDADLFVGYGGVVSREHVKKNTGSYLTDKNLMGIQRFVLN